VFGSEPTKIAGNSACRVDFARYQTARSLDREAASIHWYRYKPSAVARREVHATAGIKQYEALSSASHIRHADQSVYLAGSA
jgi:hypothetical protein